MTLSADEWDKLYGLVLKAAKRTLYKFPNLVEADDIAQDVMLRFVESEGAARKTIDNYETDPKLTHRMIANMCEQVASKEANDYRKFKGDFVYSTWMVRRLLDKGLLISEERESFHEAQTEALATGRSSKKDFSDHVDYDDKIDLHLGFKELKPEYQEILQRRYMLHEGLSDAEHMTVTRAVEALAMHMNSIGAKRQADHDGPGSRKAISNATAQALTGRGWEG